jgi:hypothetical protein
MIKKDAIGDYKVRCDKCKEEYPVPFYEISVAIDEELTCAGWVVADGVERPYQFCPTCTKAGKLI